MKFASVLAAALAVAIVPNAAPPPARAADASIVVSQGVDADTLDPLRVSVTTSTNVHVQMYDPLAWPAGPGKWTPRLATSWKRIAPTVWEFKLRPNVVFSNGDPFTSDDVAFTVQKIQDPAYKSQQIPRVDTIARVETPSPLVVRFVTKRPTPLPPAIMRPILIADAKYWRAHNDAYLADHPMGTGPYVLKRWSKDEAVELDANSRYWGPKPAIAHVTFKPIPEAGARVGSLETGASDLITNVPWQFATRLVGGRTTRMASTKSVRVLFVSFNTLQPGPQKDVRVRRALNLAVDVPQIVRAVLGGRAYELGEPVPPDFVGYDPTIPPYRYDPVAAKRLLADAGYPDGKGLHLTLNTPMGRYNGDRDVAQAIAGQLAKIGVQVDVKPQEWVSYIGQVNRRALGPMFVLGWGNITYDADNTLGTFFLSDSPMSTYNDPALDKIVDDARYELDATKRRALYAKAMRMIYEAAPWIFLFQYEDLYATTKRLVWEPRADEAIFCADMKLR